MLRKGHGDLYKLPAKEERRKQKAKRRGRSDQVSLIRFWTCLRILGMVYFCQIIQALQIFKSRVPKNQLMLKGRPMLAILKISNETERR